MPMRNLMSIVAAVAVGVWAYFGVLERITMLETKSQLAEKDLNQAVERIGDELEKTPSLELNGLVVKWAVCLLTPEQFMLIEHIAGQLEQIQKSMESMMNNGVNIKKLQEDVKILREDVEKLKDSNRDIIYKNGKNQ